MSARMTTGQQPMETITPIQLLNMELLAEVPAPFVRITTCGLLSLEVIEEIVSTDPPQARYRVFTAEDLHGLGPAPALLLLKLFTSRPQRFALRDWLMQQFCRERELFSNVRLDNIASQLRSLLCPDAYEGLRKHLVTHARSRSDSGDGYQLASYPLIWIDHEALAWNVEQAARMERFGDDPLPFWERACALAKGGEYLPDMCYSDWATQRREEVAGMRKQSVRALARLYQERHGKTGEEEALLLLRSYWNEHPHEEDVLRPLMELLARHDCYQEALEYYEQLCTLLKEEGCQPDSHTQDVAAFVRAKQIQRIAEGATRKQGEIRSLSSFSFSDRGKDGLLIPFSFAHTHAIIQETSLSVEGPEQNVDVAPKGDTLPVPDRSPSRVLGDLSSPSLLLLHLFEVGVQFMSMVAQTAHWSTEEAQRRTLQALEEFMKQPGELSRRQMLAFLAGVSGSVLGFSHIHPLPSSLEDMIPWCTANITICWHLGSGNRQDMLMAKSVATSYLPILMPLAHQASPCQAQAANLVAQCYRLLALLGYHLENLAVAEEQVKQAVVYSRAAQDTDLLVTSLGLHALICYYANRPEKAREKCEEASTSLEQATPAVQSYLYRIQAACLAQLDEEQLALHTLDLAHEAFHRHPPLETPFLHAAHDSFELLLWDGITRAHLSQQAAIASLEKVASRNAPVPIPERVRTGFLTNLVFAELSLPAPQRDLERCAAIWQEAASGAMALQSELRFTEVSRAYREMLVAFPGEQRIKQLRGHLQKWD